MTDRKNMMMKNIFFLLVGNRTVAAECAATFLLFYPSDEKMLERLKEYQADLGKEVAIPAREVTSSISLI